MLNWRQVRVLSSLASDRISNHASRIASSSLGGVHSYNYVVAHRHLLPTRQVSRIQILNGARVSLHGLFLRHTMLVVQLSRQITAANCHIIS